MTLGVVSVLVVRVPKTMSLNRTFIHTLPRKMDGTLKV